MHPQLFFLQIHNIYVYNYLLAATYYLLVLFIWNKLNKRFYLIQILS
jgi:hypothetical protein